MELQHLYRAPGVPEGQRRTLLDTARTLIGPEVTAVDTEHCFNIALRRPLSAAELEALRWLLAETFEPERCRPTSFLEEAAGPILEVGPRLSFTTAWSTNAVAVCHACGLADVLRIERSRRYLLRSSRPLADHQPAAFLSSIHDRMTECRYPEPLRSFATGVEPDPVVEVPVLEQGRAALARINRELGLAFDDRDLDYYTELFARRLGRNPTSVECFDIAQSNSEHSRHWFFKGRLVIDGAAAPDHLIGVVRQTLEANPNNSVIAFADNSSAIRGHRVRVLHPATAGAPSPLVPRSIDEHLLFTAETHNFPSGVAPFPGAETGTGGRLRDTHATGRGSLFTAGTAAYCVGNLRIPGYQLPWEDPGFPYPSNLAPPLQIEIEASNGASDYGNKFGEPVIAGYTRSFGLRLPNGERREWIKPIMFSGGIGRLDARHAAKQPPEPGMLVVKVGGPAYRIGMGGGAASSMVQGENAAELDFNAVQRGDAEMEQKLNRVIRACSELGDDNPIVSIHDQGAGGNCNVLKEIVDPAGATIEIRSMPVGDDTLSVLEIWGAEYQENDALLLKPEHAAAFRALCEREKVPVALVGRVTGDGRVVVHDERDGSTPVDLALADVLGDMPQKTFALDRVQPRPAPLALPEGLTVRAALERVLRLLSVGSKRFLTTKVDRAVTGLIARQPCAGPLQLTVADVAVIAHSHLGTTGGATAIGEQPIKGLLDPAAMARLTVGEALTNLVWARVSALPDVRCSANWMWAAKLPGEGAALHDAAVAMRDLMITLGIAVDGGKDSISMAALAPDGEVVKAPGSLVVSAYVGCPDITATVTPDLKLPGCGVLLWVDLGGGRRRLGGSALAQVFGQVGEEPPDVDDSGLLARAFAAVQELIAGGLVSAGHDRSDGGLVTTLLEMAFAGDCGIEVDLRTEPAGADPIAVLFAEELGLVLEVDPGDLDEALAAFAGRDVPCVAIGRTLAAPVIRIGVAGELVLEEQMRELRGLWEATSFELDRLQADPVCVAEERAGLRHRRPPAYALSFTPAATPPAVLRRRRKLPVAILREEGSNGDREMAAAFHLAGFEPWDVTMSDLLAGRVTLERFRGLAAVGGFSYADVLDSAKGWAGVIRFNDGLRGQFDAFHERPDTFSLGVCNGCQLFALLGWLPWRGLPDTAQPRFIQNASGRFESRFATVTILDSPAVMLRGMAGSTLGIWVQHGEGRACFPEQAVLERVLADHLAPIRFADDGGAPTEAYPLNPNGSPHGIAALTSPDGRHLALMPHPERTFLTWQWGWMPRDWQRTLAASPWLKLFQNAREWCERG
ncbi:MAG TPA: phosphoribosylformylglycinamidine synthase [Thermoanaerobaculales bacterium]|nr:phosphoribosylformylglycinamidine synthase [Thermoanaerobaculales bacterium]